MSIAAKYESLQDFFTDAEELRRLMVELLGDVTGLSVLEPCAGEGAFIKDLIGKPGRIDAIEISERYVEVLRNKFPLANILHQDFLRFFVEEPLLRAALLQPSYDAVICNPPYGLKLDINFRKVIKKAFPDIYARESYGLFFHFALCMLKRGGRYVFIVPDTFMASRNHRSLREFILKAGSPTHLIQFKSKRFESVNFGYGNLCILAGKRDSISRQSTIKWVDATDYDGNINKSTLDNAEDIGASELIDHAKDGWFLPTKRKALTRFKDSVLLGEIAECRTGIYTGDNERFLGYNSELLSKKVNGHAINWEKVVRTTELNAHEKMCGITAGPHYVPIIRGGHRKPFEDTCWAIDWSKKAVIYYGENKKARLQNQSFYFLNGLAVPMVTSGRLSASLMHNSIFDQGVVGIFAADSKFVPFLLIFLNDPLATEMKLSINPSANNSSNYLKRLPVPKMDEAVLEESAEIVSVARKTNWENTADRRYKLVRALMK